MKPVTIALTMLLSSSMAAPADSNVAAIAPRDPAPAMNAVAVMKSETKFADQVSELINKQHASSNKRDLSERETAEKAQVANQAQQALQAVQALGANKALATATGGVVNQLVNGVIIPLLQNVVTVLASIGIKRDVIESDFVKRDSADLADLAAQAQQALHAVQALAANKALAAESNGAISTLITGTILPIVNQLLQDVAGLVSSLGLKRDEPELSKRAGGDLLSGLLGTVTNLLNGLLGGLLGSGNSSAGGSASAGGATGSTGSTGSTGAGSGTSAPALNVPDLNSILGSLTGATSGAVSGATGSGSGTGAGASGSFPDITSTLNSILNGVSKRDNNASGFLGVVSKLISTIAVDVKELQPAAAKFAEAAELARKVAESHAAQAKKQQKQQKQH